MNKSLCASLGVIMAVVTPLSSEILVYEYFDYNYGDNVNTPLNGGSGFSGSWVPGQQGGVITVWDESVVGTTQATKGGEIEWDGNYTDLTTSPTPRRYIGPGTTGADRITANRVLSQNADQLAGEDNVLWASIIWHQQGSNYGRHVGFTLGTDGLANRSVNIDKTGSFGAGVGDGVGVGGAFNTGLVTPAIWIDGNIVDRTTTDAANVSYSSDNLVVLKFVFGSPDKVYAYRFVEGDDLLESTFDTYAVFAEANIDESTLNMISFSQSRGQEAMDEIRLGDTFSDIMGEEVFAPEPPTVTIGPNAGTPGNYDFVWTSLDDYYYDLVSSTDLSTPARHWPVWEGNVNILGTSPNDSLMDVAGGADPKRFFAIIEKPLPTFISEDFLTDNGGFTVSTASGTSWAFGNPESNGVGGSVTSGSGDSPNCWGTGIGNPGHYTDPTVTRLRSRVIDLTGAAGAQLTFDEALDFEAPDTAVVNIIDDDTDAIIAAGIYTATDGDIFNANWGPANGGTPIDLAAGLGNKVRIEWVFSGTGGIGDDYMGWYIGDVVITELFP